MNRINNISRFFMICLMVFSVYIFTACDDDDKDNMIVLNSFGPSPALRGGELRFIGVNLNRVTGVVIPGTAEITDIVKVDEREIKITVPQDAEPGYVILKTPQGDIKTTTLLTYEEPITVDKITTTLIKAGSVFTIEGDYLNLIKEVIFYDGAVVEQPFVSQTRKKIEVKVPLDAQSGKVIVSNGAEIPIEVYSPVDAQIVEPVFKSFSPELVKAGKELTITGSDLNLIASVMFGGLVDVSEVTVNEDNDELVVVVPFEAKDGQVTLVAASGLNYVIKPEEGEAPELKLVVPTDLVATPATDIKPGDIITITGKDLDLVTTLTFPYMENIDDGLEEGEKGVDRAIKPISQSATQLKVAMPEKAISGDLLLNMANETNVTVSISTFKPTVSAYNPTDPSAGSELVIEGTNLDLVASVTFGGDQTAEVISATANQLKVKIPVFAEAGPVILNMKHNLEPVECASLNVLFPDFCFITTLPDTSTEEGKIVAGTVTTLEIMNGDKLQEVQIGGVTTQFIVRGADLNVLVPKSADGDTEFRLISGDGEATYTINVTPSFIIDVLWEGTRGPIGWTAPEGEIALTADMIKQLVVGKSLGVEFEHAPGSTWWQARIMGSWWTELPTPKGDPRYNPDESVKAVVFGSDDTSYEFILTQEDIDILTNQGAILFCGGGIILKSLYVKTFI